jgi:hypothetical protein
MVKDFLKALQVFDGREAAMGRVWLTMNNLKKHIFNLWNLPFNLPGCIGREHYKEMEHNDNRSLLHMCIVKSVPEGCHGKTRKR